MEESINSFRPLDPSREGVRPIRLIARLMQQTTNMQSVDEVFPWLAQAMVQSLDIGVVQFLAIQWDDDGQFHAEVRAIASQNPSTAQTGYINNQVIAVARRVFHEQRGIISRPVESVFPPLQASLLAQHDLRCWTGYFLRNDAFLPSARAGRGPMQMPAPRNMIVSLFTLYPLSTDQVRAIRFILEQSARIISSKEFPTLRAVPAAQKNPDVLLAHAHVIPQRTENIERFQADNPFANASIIIDKNARRLYTAIDGDKNLAELAQTTSFGPKGMLDALRYLFEQQKIRFYTLKEGPIENPEFILPSS